MSKLQDLILRTANQAREEENYKIATLLCSIAMDYALLEERNNEILQLKQAIKETKEIKSELIEVGLLKIAGEIDLIAKDLESKLIEFESQDPIEAVLSSYALIHKVAQVQTSENPMTEKIKAILEKAETEVYDEGELEKLLLEEIKDFSDEDKRNILYILDKDYQLDLDLTKQASKFDKKTIEDKLKFDPSMLSEEEKDRISEKSKEIKKQFHDKEMQDEEDYVWRGSFPSSPPMWGGFSYQAIVPYQQTSQINFWSLASEESLLRRIAKPKSS